MSYKIKHVKEIVFAFISIPVIVLLVAFVFIAIRQNMLAKKYIYRSTISDALGISLQTPILYRGFEIGRVRSFELREDGNISLIFHVFKKYKNIMVTGSVLVRSTNPITSKTTLEFIRDRHSETPIPEEGNIPSADFRDGRQQLRKISSRQGDPISTIINNFAQLTSDLLQDDHTRRGVVPRFLVNIADASEKANASLDDVQIILSEVARLTSNMNKDNNASSGVVLRLLNNMAEISEGLVKQMDDLDRMMKAAQIALDNYGDPDSLLIRMIDPSQQLIIKPLSETFNNLSAATDELTGILDVVNDPELRLLMTNLNDSLARAKRTLEAMNNNPLLRRGITPTQQKQGPAPNRIHEVPGER